MLEVVVVVVVAAAAVVAVDVLAVPAALVVGVCYHCGPPSHHPCQSQSSSLPSSSLSSLLWF